MRLQTFHPLFILLLLVWDVAGDTIPEQLFLDLSISAVRNRTARINLVEPWASEYCTAVSEKRYGDAIFARYNIAGQAVDGIYTEWNITVFDMIMSDAQEYAQDHPELYTEALQLYNSTSSKDTRPDILEGLKAVTTGKIAARTTWGISCSADYLAKATYCHYMLEWMGESTTRYYGSTRDVDFYRDCNLRLGPLNSRPDSSQYAIHSVAELIYDDCRRATTEMKVSGFSPANTGHRKICLSSKTTGCS